MIAHLEGGSRFSQFFDVFVSKIVVGNCAFCVIVTDRCSKTIFKIASKSASVVMAILNDGKSSTLVVKFTNGSFVWKTSWFDNMNS